MRSDDLKTDVAIIGMGCRMPGEANTPEQFWEFLSNKKDGITDIPLSRKDWNPKKYYDPKSKPGKYYVRTGGFLNDKVIREFDSEFFRISSREADNLDPQHRILLEVTWEALENAGIAPSTLEDTNTSVFVGIHWDDYSSERYYAQSVKKINAYSTLSNLRSLSAGRIAHFFDLHGTVMQIDTACSSGLVGLVSACKSLQNNESDISIAAGISLLITPHLTMGFCQMNVLSKDGRCKTFSADADGFSQGEGCNIMILKRLSDAIRDADNILAVIKGFAINHDGRSLTITTPSSLSQQKMLKAAIDNAGIAPIDMQYIETHGTGTSLGDYIEVSALARVMDNNRDDTLYLGSVKTNVGHLGASAGLAGLMKIVLSMNYNKIPANLHFNKPNSRITWDKYPFKIPQELTDWAVDKKKIAGVSAFGMSGTNVHVICEEFSDKTNVRVKSYIDSVEMHVLNLSAKTNSSLHALVKKYESFIQKKTKINLADVCYTANIGRDHFNNRFSIVVSSVEELASGLQDYLHGKNGSGNIRISDDSKSGGVAFLFTGQGSQYINMGLELYELYPVFRETLDSCAKILEKYMDQPLKSILYPTETKNHNMINQTCYTQPAIFAIEYSLAQLWLSWGIKPDVMMGHSVGEYVAACVAGIFSLEDALNLVANRGKLIDKLASNISGAMLSILADEHYVMQVLAPHKADVAIAAVNGPNSIVISGKDIIIDIIEKQLQERSITTHRLTVSHAFHSSLMNPVLEEFQKIAELIDYSAPTIPVVSNVLATVCADEMLVADYWVKHITEPVRFFDSVLAIIKMDVKNLIEVGPRPILIDMISQSIVRRDSEELEYLPSIRPSLDAATILTSLSKLYVKGISIDWKNFYQKRFHNKVILPNYCFDRKDHWVDVKLDSRDILRASSVGLDHPFIESKISSPLLLKKQTQLELLLSPQELNYISDHKIFSKIICPASVYIEAILSGARLAYNAGSVVLKDISIEKALEVDEEKILQLVVTHISNEEYEWKIHKLVKHELEEPYWDRYVVGKVSINNTNPSNYKLDIKALQSTLEEVKDINDFYQNLANKEINYGASLRNIKKLWCNKNEALGYIALNTECIDKKYSLHPALLDACFHVLLAALPRVKDCLYLPIGYQKFTFWQYPVSEVYSYVSYDNSTSEEILSATLKLVDKKGNVLAELQGCKLRKTTNVNTISNIKKSPINTECTYRIEWHKPDSDHLLRNTSNIDSKCLIISDELGLTDLVYQKLKQNNKRVTIIAKQEDVNSAYWSKVFENNNFHEILYLGNIVNEERSQVNCKFLLSLVQYIKINSIKSRLWLITKGCQAVNQLESELSIWQSSILGMSKTVMLELDSPVVCLDLDLDASHKDNSSNINQIISIGINETQLAYRNGELYCARLVPHKIQDLLVERKILKILNYGVLRDLKMQHVKLNSPNTREVEVQTVFSGINFRDLLRMLGMMRAIEDPTNSKPANKLIFGYECAGIVTRVGSDVNKFKVGDEVIVYKAGSIASVVVASENLVTLKPKHISFAEASTIPVAYLTAYYALIKCAKLKSSDKVLVHNAAGGVGQAAIQLAKSVGAEIFATAHPSKWSFLKSIGVKNIYSSRNVDFMEQIIADTKGGGVDVILNSLNGEFVDKSVGVLKADGRFVEIGKLLVWDEKKFHSERPNAEFYMFDLGQMKDKKISLLLHEIMDMISNHVINPIPVREYDISDAESAFRHIQQAKHIGKIALNFGVAKNTGTVVREDGSYLVTGGIGGLGFQVFLWLVNKGAKKIVLTSRNKPNEDINNIIAQQGIEVQFIQADISNYDEIKNVINHCSNLKGIIHTAGIIDDNLIDKQTENSFQNVMTAKVDGTWNLHNLTKNIDLDYFICFSSVASLMGSAGQSNYSAANAFMDQFAHYRKKNGLKCTAINWGPWGEVGMAASLSKRLSSQGYEMIPVEYGMLMLEKIICFSDLPQISVLPMNWQKFLEKFDKLPPFFDVVKLTNFITNANVEFLIDKLRSAEIYERHDMAVEHLTNYIREIIGIGQDVKISEDVSLFDLGLDSLMAVELKNVLEKNMKTTLRSTLLFDYPNIKSLLEYLSKEISIFSENDTPDDHDDRILQESSSDIQVIEELRKLKDTV